MKKHILNDGDKQDINFLFNIEKTILDTNYQLSILESQGLKQTEAYKHHIEILKSYKIIENNLINNLSNESNKTITIINEITKTFPPLNFENQINALIESDNQFFIIARIISGLKSSLTNDNQDIFKNVIGKCINPQNKKTINIDPKGFLNLDFAIKNDIAHTILLFLDNELNSISDEETYKELIEIKYMLSFMYLEIENEFIKQNYEIQKDLYLTSDAYATIGNIPYDVYKCYYKGFNKSLYEIGASFLINLPNDFFDDGLPIMLKVFLKTSLVLDDESLSQQLKNQLANVKRTNGTDMILNLIENIEQDRKIPKIITLQLKKKV